MTVVKGPRGQYTLGMFVISMVHRERERVLKLGMSIFLQGLFLYRVWTNIRLKVRIRYNNV